MMSATMNPSVGTRAVSAINTYGQQNKTIDSKGRRLKKF